MGALGSNATRVARCMLHANEDPSVSVHHYGFNLSIKDVYVNQGCLPKRCHGRVLEDRISLVTSALRCARTWADQASAAKK